MWMSNNAVPVAPRSGALPPLPVILGALCIVLLLFFVLIVLLFSLTLACALVWAMCATIVGPTAAPLLFLLGLVGLLALAAHLYFYFNPLPPLQPGLTRQEVQESREQQVLELLQDWREAWW